MRSRRFSCALLADTVLLFGLAPLSQAADTPVGQATCAGAFRLDGAAVSNTATLFAGSRIEDSGGSCVIRAAAGATVRMGPQSAGTITPAGFELSQGSVVMVGHSQLRIPSATAVLQLNSPDTAVNAQLVDGVWTLNVATGSAQLVGIHGETFAILDKGTLATFIPAADQPAGLSLAISGCIASEQDRWYLQTGHISRKIELLEDTVRKNRQPVSLIGALQPLPLNSTALAASLRVVSEKPTDEKCPAFRQVSDRRSVIEVGIGVGVLLAQILSAISGSATAYPGQSTQPASVP